MKNPYTKLHGYVIAKPSPYGDWFVVQSSYAPFVLSPGSRYPWCVTSTAGRQTIFTETKREALDIAAQGADGVGLDKWEYEVSRAGKDRVRPSHLT